MHLRVRTAVPAGEPLQAGALDVVEQDTPGALIEPLPQMYEIEGAVAARDLAPGEIVTHRSARVPFAVRSGDAVVVRVVAGAVEARGTAKAQQSGRVGDVIRVVNADSRRGLRARIVGRGEVEVVHGS
jgi:flagella basal body P-ring formation protein FlgA